MNTYHPDLSFKRKIMNMKSLSDKQRLQAIFDIDKEDLKKEFPELYYCILAVLDEDKISTPGDYFKSDNS